VCLCMAVSMSVCVSRHFHLSVLVAYNHPMAPSEMLEINLLAQVCCIVLRCVAVCGSVRQYVAVCCSQSMTPSEMLQINLPAQM